MPASHAHEHEQPRLPVSAGDVAKGSQLIWAAGLTAFIMVAEAVGGWLTHSLALLSDAAHVFSDVAALVLAGVALRLALRPPTDRHTYGLHRSEIFAALLNALALLIICGLIFWEAYRRLLAPPEVKTGLMLVIAAVGLLVNLVVVLRLRGHAHGDLNLRSAYLHVFGDLLASVAVIVAALFMALTPFSWRYLADPVLSALIGLLILSSALRVGGESLHILMEGVPRGVHLEDIIAAVTAVPAVRSVHSLHAWSLCSNLRAVSLHVVADYSSEAERRGVLREVEGVLRTRFGFALTTIETECDEVCPAEVIASRVRHLDTPEDNSLGHQH